jgi:hypothetical protein
MPGTITHREFKLLLKAEKFPVRRALHELNDVIAKSAAAAGVKYVEFESLDSQMRLVQFYDTQDQTLRKNQLIFRIRQVREGGWPDESWEVTFKCRAGEFEAAAGFDSRSTFPQQKLKFKEEILRGDELGTIKLIYSNNCVLESGEKLDVTVPFSRLSDSFPHIKTLDLNMDETLRVVNGARIFEIQANLGTLSFGHHVVATTTLALWVRPVPDLFQPIVAEFGWSYHPVHDEKGKAADALADEFFKDIQVPLKDWLATGSTKTALIYGDKGN